MSTTTTPIRVTVFGPNLSGPAQRKGYMHVHAAGCADCAHYGPGRKYQGDDNGWTIEATSRESIVRAIYCDHMDEDPDRDWTHFDDLYIAPCVKSLPVAEVA